MNADHNCQKAEWKYLNDIDLATFAIRSIRICVDCGEDVDA